MESSVRFLMWVVGGFTAISLGANWFIQAKILNCSTEKRGKLARGLWWWGLILLAVGVVSMILAFIW